MTPRQGKGSDSGVDRSRCRLRSLEGLSPTSKRLLSRASLLRFAPCSSRAAAAASSRPFLDFNFGTTGFWQSVSILSLLLPFTPSSPSRPVQTPGWIEQRLFQDAAVCSLLAAPGPDRSSLSDLSLHHLPRFKPRGLLLSNSGRAAWTGRAHPQAHLGV